MPRNVSVSTVELCQRPAPLNTSSAAHHVVPKALGQLFVPLYGEVEAVVSEEGHIDFPVLLGDTKHSQLTECDLSKASSGSCRTRQPRESLVSAWRLAAIHLPTWHRCDVAYRQAWRVSLLQEGLKHHGEVFLEEAVAVQELLQSPLSTEKKQFVYTSQRRITRLVQNPLRKGWMRQSDSGFLMVEDDLRCCFPR